jgi:hypothetical protein
MLMYPCVYGLIIPLMYAGFKALSVRLTEYENHRTEAQFCQHLTVKVFLFKFAMVFASLYYYAFWDAVFGAPGGGADGGAAAEFVMLRAGVVLMSLVTVGQLSQASTPGGGIARARCRCQRAPGRMAARPRSRPRFLAPPDGAARGDTLLLPPRRRLT